MGKTLTLKATGETMKFVKTSMDTNGSYLKIIIHQPANQEGPPLHKHTMQSEYFEVLEGTAGIQSGEEKKILQPGESFTVPKNTYHTYFAADQQPLKLRIKIMPALDIEYFLVETYTSSNRHKSENPSFIDNCYMISEMKGQYFTKKIPVIFQKIVYPLLAKLGSLLKLVKVRSKHAFTF